MTLHQTNYLLHKIRFLSIFLSKIFGRTLDLGVLCVAPALLHISYRIFRLFLLLFYHRGSMLKSEMRCVVGWVSRTTALWHLICSSSCCLRGSVRLPVLMHCSITKVPVWGVGEERRGLTAENVCPSGPAGPRVTWPTGRQGLIQLRDNQAEYETKRAVTVTAQLDPLWQEESIRWQILNKIGN